MTWVTRVVRPSLAFLLVAGLALVGSATDPARNSPINDLPIQAGIAGFSGVVWLVLELAARARGAQVRWLAWISLASQATSAGLLFLGQTMMAADLTPAWANNVEAWLDRISGSPNSWGLLTIGVSGYFIWPSWIAILPAIIFVMFQPKRIKPKEIEAAFT